MGAIAETPKAHIASTLNSHVMNVRARMKYWGANGSIGFRNCGKNAVKNRMALGLLDPTKKPLT